MIPYRCCMRIWTRLFIIGSLLTSLGVFAYLGWSTLRELGVRPSDLQPVLQPSDPAGFSFIVLGDNEGDNAVFRAILSSAQAETVDFLIAVGDLTPRSDPADFNRVKELLQALPFPYYTAVGNNDIVGDETRSRYLAAFSTGQLGLPDSNKTYYSFNHKGAHFIVLDNASRKVGFSDDQLDWLESDLSANDNRWTFLFLHRPVNLPLTELYGDDETTASRKTNDRFAALIGRYPITRIFSGHLHTFFTYSLGAIPVTITGGGGAAPQQAFSAILGPQYHYVKINVLDDEVIQEVRRIDEPD